MKKLEFENIEYQYLENDEYKEHKFASIKKTSTFKNNKKYQTLTIKHEHLEQFKKFLKDIIGESIPDDDELF